MQDDDQQNGSLPRVLMIRDEPVMLAADVARAFDVEAREITQAIKRNPLKFNERHAFQLSEDEREDLRSQAVISGKGWTPTVLTQKGIVRLATVLNSPKALDATDQIIDLFLDIYRQLKAGHSQVTIANPSRLIPDEEHAAEVRSLRRRVVKGLGDLLDTTIDSKTKTTVGDELGEIAQGTLGHLKAWLKTPQIKNDQITAETLKLLEQTRDIYERRQADLKKSHAETEKLTLENVKTKIDLVEKLLTMADKLEPGSLAQVLPHFATTTVLLPAPKRAKSERDKQ